MPGFIILGCPRSGTNLLSNVLRIPQYTLVQIEPFSMHTGLVLKWDLIKNSPVRDLLLPSSRQNPFVNEVYKYLAGDGLRFIKETSLFEHLDILHSVLGTNKVIYIERDIKSIANSYIKHDLKTKWTIEERIFFQKWKSTYFPQSKIITDEMVIKFSMAVTLKKRKYWSQYKQLYNSYCITYEDLISNTATCLSRLFQFVGLNPGLIDIALGERNLTYGGKAKYEYATFHG